MVDISLIRNLPKRLPKACCITGVFKDGKLTDAAQQLDELTDGCIAEALARGDITGDAGQTQLLYPPTGSGIDRIILTGLGAADKLDATSYRKAIVAASKVAVSTTSQHILSTLTDIPMDAMDAKERCYTNALLIADAYYRFMLHPRADQKTRAAQSATLKKISLLGAKSCQSAAEAGLATSGGCDLARDLGNLAANICTPTYLAKQARQLARGSKQTKVTVLDEAQMAKLGMGAFLSVSRGSREPAKLIAIEYKGGTSRSRPIVFVGKGVTFDTGGISIKPSAGMDEMKYDMCGAASVLGLAQACIAMQPKANLVFVVAAAENMPDGDASKPGDVVTTMSGQSVEILNTDAEGRLVLCDTLTYVERYKPAAVIDMATLTGACIIALGHVASAVMGNDDELTQALCSAGMDSGDKAWQLPLWSEYEKQLDSNFADLANIGGRPAGTITAGCFLARFAEAYPWAHIDIAGVAWNSGAAKGATGRPIPLLMQYLINNGSVSY